MKVIERLHVGAARVAGGENVESERLEAIPSAFLAAQTMVQVTTRRTSRCLTN